MPLLACRAVQKHYVWLSTLASNQPFATSPAHHSAPKPTALAPRGQFFARARSALQSIPNAAATARHPQQTARFFHVRHQLDSHNDRPLGNRLPSNRQRQGTCRRPRTRFGIPARLDPRPDGFAVELVAGPPLVELADAGQFRRSRAALCLRFRGREPPRVRAGQQAAPCDSPARRHRRRWPLRQEHRLRR